MRVFEREERFALRRSREKSIDLRPWRRKVPRRGERERQRQRQEREGARLTQKQSADSASGTTEVRWSRRETETGKRGCKTDAEAECGQRQWHH